MISCPKRRFELVLHDTKSQETTLIDTAVKSNPEDSGLPIIIQFNSILYYLCAESTATIIIIITLSPSKTKSERPVSNPRANKDHPLHCNYPLPPHRLLQ
jgi:hypothetical protein